MAVALFLVGLLVAVAGGGAWAYADANRDEEFVPISEPVELDEGSYEVSWLAPAHSDCIPFADDVRLELASPAGEPGVLSAPRLLRVSPWDSDSVRSDMGVLRVATPGRYRILAVNGSQFCGVLQVRTRSSARTEVPSRVAAAGLAAIGGGTLLYRRRP